MKRSNLEQFYQIAAHDQELQEKLKAAIDPEAFAKFIVEIGEAKGYIFTTKEVEAAIQEAEAKEDQEGLWQELEERELEAVVGGIATTSGGGPASVMSYARYARPNWSTGNYTFHYVYHGGC